MPSPSEDPIHSEPKAELLVGEPAANAGRRFLLKTRLISKDGVKKCVRIPYSVGDSVESIKHALLEKFVPEDAKPFDDSDYVVDLEEVWDEDWLIEIKSTEDLFNLVDDFVHAQSSLKLSAFIRHKSDPPRSDRPMVAHITSAGEKRKVVTPVKKAKKLKLNKRISPTAINGGNVRARIIGALAELRALGKEDPPRIEVAFFAGYRNAASKGFSNPLSTLRTEGIVEYRDKKTVSLTAAGLEAEEAKGISPPRSNTEVHNRIKALLKPKEQQIFDLLAADGGAEPLDRDSAAAAVGYSNPASKGWANAIGKMSSLGLLHYPINEADPKKKLVQLTDMCFPFSKQQTDVSPLSLAPYREPTPQSMTFV